ncbi:MAG: hypothetical protein GJ680_07870 [Alteromonadaceae bacterium]|nr:hypothetical protein [Alteromonadaceae bacterium]
MALIDLSHTNLKPPLISLGSATLKDVVAVSESMIISRSEKAVLFGIQSVIDEKGERYCSAEQVGRFLGRRDETVRQALKKLVEKNIFREEACRTHPVKIRRSALFVFNEEYDKKSLQYSQKGQGKLVFSKSYFDLIDRHKELSKYGLADDLICGYLFCVLEYNHKKHSDKIEGMIFIDGEPIRVSAIAPKGKRVALVKDLRYYLAILRLCEQEMEMRIAKAQAGELEKAYILSSSFHIMEIDVLKVMGHGSGSGERENMSIAMERLDDTDFYIDSAPAHIMEQLGLDKYKLKVSHFKVREYMKSKDDRVVYRLELDQTTVTKMYQALCNNLKLFNRADQRIMSEVNSLKFAFLLFSVTQSPGSIQSYNWQSLKDKVAPRMAMRDFKQSMSKLLKKHATMIGDDELAFAFESDNKVVNECMSDIYGISITYTVETGFQIQRLPTDTLLEEAKMVAKKIPSSL